MRQSIGFQDIKNMILPLPPREEQDRIAEFVDTKSVAIGTIIDNMVTKLKHEIALLGQYKTQMSADIITGKIDLQNIEVTDFVPDETADEELEDNADD